MLLVDWLSEDDAVVVGALDVEGGLLAVLVLEEEVLHGDHKVGPFEAEEEIFFYDFIKVFLVGGSALDVERVAVHAAVGYFAEGLADDCFNHEGRQSDIRRAEGEYCRECLIIVLFGVFQLVLDADI